MTVCNPRIKTYIHVKEVIFTCMDTYIYIECVLLYCGTMGNNDHNGGIERAFRTISMRRSTGQRGTNATRNASGPYIGLSTELVDR